MEKPRLSVPTAESPANLMIISGFPWYVTEAMVRYYLLSLYPSAAPLTTRLYTNPVNGSSRGHCMVEYHTTNCAHDGSHRNLPPSELVVVKDKIEEAIEHHHPVDHGLPMSWTPNLQVQLYTLNNIRFDREGGLPELPTDPPNVPTLTGYGDQGFAVRCAEPLHLPNTTTAEGMARLASIRKKRARTSTLSAN